VDATPVPTGSSLPGAATRQLGEYPLQGELVQLLSGGE
jgi:hypothetical protein